jgi:hypothetical protein
MSGLTGDQLIYGPINGDQSPGYPVGITASQTFTRQGGCFVTAVSGYCTVSGATSATLLGWANVGHLNNDSTFPYVSNSTSGVDVASVILASDCVFRLAVGSGTFAQTNVGTRYDLVVGTVNGVASVQGVALGTTSHQIVIVVGGDLVNNNWVDVIMNPATRGI